MKRTAQALLRIVVVAAVAAPILYTAARLVHLALSGGGPAVSKCPVGDAMLVNAAIVTFGASVAVLRAVARRTRGRVPNLSHASREA